jgi:hypothetical protein
MPRFIIYTILLFGVCGYAFWRGRSDERLAAAVCLIASVASLALLGPARLRYSGVELGVLAVDLFTLAAFTYVALRSDRFWPLWISGLQLTTSVGHVLKAIDSQLVPFAYAAALRVWSYPILIILAVAVWRGQRMQFARSPQPN